MEYSPDFTAPHDNTPSTPAGRKIRAWAADRGPEVRAAADGLAQALWASANNPPSRLMDAVLRERKAAFDRVKGDE